MQFKDYQGEFTGAIANSIVVIPMAIGYGIIAMAPLGPAYASKGALMGLYAAIFCGFFAAFVGRTPVQMTGPKAPLALVIASVVAGLWVSPYLPESLAARPEIIISLTAVCVLIAGVVQLLCGALGLGNIVKYIPHPVIAGFMNGIALLLITKQLKSILGVSSKVSYLEILNHPQSIQLLSVLVGGATLGALFLARGRIKAIPAPFAAFIVGIVIYYGLSMCGQANSLGPIIGTIPAALPRPDAFVNLIKYSHSFNVWPLIPTLLLSGLFIGILGAMDSLLSAVVSSNLTGVRTNSKKELIGQGIGNLVCSLFNGLPGAGSVPGVMTTYAAGGRTPAAGLISGVAVLLIITLFGPLVGKVPLSVIAGIIIGVACMMIDKATLAMLRHPGRLLKADWDVRIDLAVNLLVAVITLGVNLLIAVGVGLVLASALFIAKMSKSVVNRMYTGTQVRSRKVRTLAQQEILNQLGKKIVVLELKGPLFFGSADMLAQEIEAYIKEVEFCILDMRRVNAIDSTAANILVNTHHLMSKAGKHLQLACLKEHPTLKEALKGFDLIDTFGADHLLPDTDIALELAEDWLLSKAGYSSPVGEAVPLEKMDLVNGLSPEQIALLSEYLVRHRVVKGQRIIRQGDTGREIYLLTRGLVSVNINLKNKSGGMRLVSFSPGVIFGEIALLDGSRRSANVVADEDTEVLELPFAAFEELQARHPQVATKLILNMALFLSFRMRNLSNEVMALDEL